MVDVAGVKLALGGEDLGVAFLGDGGSHCSCLACSVVEMGGGFVSRRVVWVDRSSFLGGLSIAEYDGRIERPAMVGR